MERNKAMAKDRITPCKYYVAFGECSKNIDANHNGYCQNATNIFLGLENVT